MHHSAQPHQVVNMSANKPILYYLPRSPAVRFVQMVAKAIDLELELKLVDLSIGEHLQPWYLALNPQHTVPTLVDTDGRVLWDSHAIATYLIGKYGGSDDHPLYPRDLYTRARIDQRLQFNAVVMYVSGRPAFRSIMFAGATGVTAEQEAPVHEAYALVEAFLASDHYLVGNELTVADLAVGPTLTQIATLVPLAADRYPKVAAWVKRLEEVPYFREINSAALAAIVAMIEGLIARNRAAQQ